MGAGAKLIGGREPLWMQSEFPPKHRNIVWNVAPGKKAVSLLTSLDWPKRCILFEMANAKPITILNPQTAYFRASKGETTQTMDGDIYCVTGIKWLLGLMSLLKKIATVSSGCRYSLKPFPFNCARNLS
jgi:hypothetical protein